MSAPVRPVAPIARETPIDALDITRGVALFGILLMNITGFGFGLCGQLARHQLYYVVGSIWLFQLVASPLGLARFRFGPLEWGWRWLSYGERPAMR